MSTNKIKNNEEEIINSTPGFGSFHANDSTEFSKGDYGYLYCHMSDKGEWTAYAVSRDGYNYQDINDGKPIFDPAEHARIEGGTRDAYITRTHNGKGYIMVTTDMCVAKAISGITMVLIS